MARGRIGWIGRLVIALTSAAMVIGQRVWPRSPAWDWLGIGSLIVMGTAAAAFVVWMLLTRNRKGANRRTLDDWIEDRTSEQRSSHTVVVAAETRTTDDRTTQGLGKTR